MPAAALGEHGGQAAGLLAQRLEPHRARRRGRRRRHGRARPRRRAPRCRARRGCGASRLSSVASSAAGARRRRTAGGVRVASSRPARNTCSARQLGDEVAVAAGGVGLALERPELAAHLAQEVAEAGEVALGGGEAALGLLLALAVLQDAGRLLDDEAALLGPGVEHRVDLALADDHVLLAADAGVGEQLLDVEQPARHAVDGVLAVAGAEQRAGDRDLGELDRQQARRVVDGERRPRPGRAPAASTVPAKMTSSIFCDAHRATAPGRRAPSRSRRRRSTCPTRSGPTTTVTPGSSSSAVVSAKDLKPFRVSVFRNIRRRT